MQSKPNQRDVLQAATRWQILRGLMAKEKASVCMLYGRTWKQYWRGGGGR